MHTNTFAILSSVLFFASSPCTARVVPPQPPRILPRGDVQSLLSTSDASLADKCTFTLFHKQLITATQSESTSKGKINYIQIDSLEDHTNGITIDVASSRPRTERNSYAKVSAKQVLTIAGLLDDTSLTIHGTDGEDALVFESDGVSWATEGGSKRVRPDAWCDSGIWVESGKGSRERTMECAFPCAKIEEGEDEEREELR
ncbi:uncharacterized protein ALTATR162_LOCUS9745 [Alternaria atra]|uniref:Uncharacterized protein n=1 Tax=Alternaria atra TaxID=119953 RepID=A0A8J2ICW2_9PLEO|nr:uncharacterized protein ALTATR162_LOCUS9745 [Alternaria atra]CAG5181404.1 unnamed protein product [Alternaria atra]